MGALRRARELDKCQRLPLSFLFPLQLALQEKGTRFSTVIYLVDFVPCLNTCVMTVTLSPRATETCRHLEPPSNPGVFRVKASILCGPDHYMPAV